MFASRLLAACFLNKRVVVGDKFPWLLKNSFALKSQKQNCVRMRYERSSRIPRHFGSPRISTISAGMGVFQHPLPYITHLTIRLTAEDLSDPVCSSGRFETIPDPTSL